MMRWNSRLGRLERQIPPAPHIDSRQVKILSHLAHRYGGTWEGARLTAVTLADGETYPLNPDSTMKPELARAILRIYDCE